MSKNYLGMRDATRHRRSGVDSATWTVSQWRGASGTDELQMGTGLFEWKMRGSRLEEIKGKARREKVDKRNVGSGTTEAVWRTCATGRGRPGAHVGHMRQFSFCNRFLALS